VRRASPAGPVEDQVFSSTAPASAGRWPLQRWSTSAGARALAVASYGMINGAPRTLARITRGLGWYSSGSGLGFGGPIALVGAMHRDLVEQRGGFPREEYREGIALGPALIRTARGTNSASTSGMCGGNCRCYTGAAELRASQLPHGSGRGMGIHPVSGTCPGCRPFSTVVAAVRW
jgi:hypothetical protein